MDGGWEGWMGMVGIIIGLDVRLAGCIGDFLLFWGGGLIEANYGLIEFLRIVI